MINAIRSELVRVRRRGVVIGWLGLTALFAVMINVVIAQVVTAGSAPPAGGPGVGFPTLAELRSPDGLVSGLSSASAMFGVVTLSFWAVATAGDYSSGLIRLLVSAQPRRGVLLGGKIAALSLATAAATTVALVVTLITAPITAGGAGIDVSAWGRDPLPVLAAGWGNLYATLLVWGVIGLALAVVARSAAVAISAGVGYVLVVESVLSAAADVIADWMPGRALTALASGGTPDIPYATALVLALAYAVACAGAAFAVFSRRDVTA